MKSIGIDIGSSSIKVAEIDSTSTSYILQDFAELPLSPEPGTDQRIEIVDHLRKIASHYGTSARYVFALPQERVAVRQVNFPFRERHKIVRSLSFELEDDIPFDQDDAIFDAKVVRVLGNTSEALAFACPKKYIDEYLKMAHEAGIDPDIITVDSAAIANIFESWGTPPREIPGPKAVQHETEMAQVSESGETVTNVEPLAGGQIIIHIGHRRTIIDVFYRGTLAATRTISGGGHYIVESLRRAYSLPYVEALKGLQDKGFVLTNSEGASQDQVEFSKIISGALKSLADELKITLLELKSTLGLNFSQAYLSGGVSRLMNISAYMTKELEIPCNLIKHLERVPKSNAELTNSLEYASLPAIGIAIEGLKRPRNPAVNLRKLEFGRQSQSFKNFVTRWGYALKLAAVGLACFYVYAFFRDGVSTGLDDTAKEVLVDTAKDSFGLKGRAATESKIKSFIKEKKIEIEARKQIADLQTLNSALDIVQILSEKMPAKQQLTVDVRRFLLQNENLTIEGEAPTKAQIDLVRGALQLISADRNVRDLAPSIKPSQGKLAFAYLLKVNRK